MINLIVPIHNEFPYLKRCFDSITCQMADDIRVILVDDHSTDGSKKYARGRSDNEGWLLLDTLPHEHGVSYARNKGLEAISTIGGSDEWVTFLDSDDELAPGAFEIMRKAIEENPDETWFQFNHLRHYSEINKTVKKYDNRDGEFNIENLKEAQCWWGVWNKLIKFSAIDYWFVEGLTFGEDGEFVLEHLIDGVYIKTIDKETVIHHFDNPNSLTKSKTREQLDELERAHRNNLMACLITERPWSYIKAVVGVIDENRNNPTYKKIIEGDSNEA